MLELLDQVKAGEVEFETPMDAVVLIMVKMGISEQKMCELMEELPDYGEEIPSERIKQIMEQFGIKEQDIIESIQVENRANAQKNLSFRQ